MSNQKDYRSSKGSQKKKSGFLSILLHYVLPYLVINSIILFFVLATPKLKVNEATETDDPAVRTLLVHVDSILPIKEKEKSKISQRKIKITSFLLPEMEIFEFPQNPSTE